MLAFVTGAFLASSGIAWGQGSIRDTVQIPGDTQHQGSMHGSMQDTTRRGMHDTTIWNNKDSIQGGTVDTMFDHNSTRTGNVIDSTRRDAGSNANDARDSVQGSRRGSVAPDNTGINKRDRNDSEMTADEQGQSPADIDLTQKIRRAIMEDDSLSTYAKNIKIISRDGMVTLKGPVRSEQEKSVIEAKATAVAGSGKVKNQIDVKAASR